MVVRSVALLIHGHYPVDGASAALLDESR